MRSPLKEFQSSQPVRFAFVVAFGFLFVVIATCVADAAPAPASDEPSKDGADTLVICASDFQHALKPWVDYRQKQGHNIVVRFPKTTPFEIKELIKKVQTDSNGQLRNVLLVGDSFDRNAGRNRLVPTDYVKAVVNVKFGSEPEIATDNSYADLDNDGIPELTIGRLPVDTPAELSHLIQRLIEYENGSQDKQWQRNINLIAGVGGFGGLVDKVVEHTTKQIVTDLIPADYQTSMTYGSWSSPYCPDPRRFSETAIARFNEGCLFWVYIGHGNRGELDRIFLPDSNHGILDMSTVHQLDCRQGSPIAICLACYTGATDSEEDGLAEAMIRQPRGPIAVVCGSRVTMPYAMSLLSLEMLNEYFRGDAETMGELMLRAKQRMVAEAQPGDQYREMIEGLGKSFSPTPRLLAEERMEHVQLMHLLGDPLLRLPRPERMALTIEPVAPGELDQVQTRPAALTSSNSAQTTWHFSDEDSPLPSNNLRKPAHSISESPTVKGELELNSPLLAGNAEVQFVAQPLGAEMAVTRRLPKPVVAGSTIRVGGTVEHAGAVLIEIAYQRDRFRHRPKFRAEYDPSDEILSAYQDDYLRAHDLVCSQQVILVEPGIFSANIKIPEDASGRCDVRAMLQSGQSFALGNAAIDVSQAPVARTARLK